MKIPVATARAANIPIILYRAFQRKRQLLQVEDICKMSVKLSSPWCDWAISQMLVTNCVSWGIVKMLAFQSHW